MRPVKNGGITMRQDQVFMQPTIKSRLVGAWPTCGNVFSPRRRYAPIAASVSRRISTTTKEVVLTRDLRAALERLNPDLPAKAIDEAVRGLTVYDVSRSMVQHNRDFYRLIRNGVPVTYRDKNGRHKSARARVFDFDNKPGMNRFLAVRELKLTGIRTPNYNRRADLVCFVNGLPLVFIELKAVHKNIRTGLTETYAITWMKASLPMPSTTMPS